MKRVIIHIYGETYNAMADAAEHAASQLRMGTPSENCEWEDRSRVDFDVVEDAQGEWENLYGEDAK